MAELINGGDPATESFASGPAIGAAVPAFQLTDAWGQLVRFVDRPPKTRALILFYRSASWWGFCKTQLVELQQQHSTFLREGIEVYAISPDPVDLLRRFADRFAIEYHLLCDADSAVIDAFGIRNTNIPEDHDWYGVPLPGMYLVDEDGRVFDKHFAADHAVRESVNSALQERFAVDIGHDGLVTAGAEGVTVRSWFSTPTIRRAQMTVLTVELNLAPGLHLYGRPLPAGYIPVELQVDGGEGLVVQQIAYPRARPRRFEVLDETLPAYENSVQLKAHCLGMAREGTVDVSVTVRYQACDSTECYLPERLTFDMNLDVLGHVAERV